MCGRFTLTTPAEQLAEAFGVADPPSLPPRYNVAPSQLVAVVGLKGDRVKRGIALLKWGLVPHWENDPKSGFKPINLRSETVLHKFGEIFRRQRRPVPLDGFYEWSGEGKQKRPYRFTRADGGVFAVAGVWDLWDDGSQRLHTCALLTTSANDLVKPLHDRMPVVIPPEHYAAWLDWDTPVEVLLPLLKPYPAELMRVAEANRAVNSPKNDGPECLEAA